MDLLGPRAVGPFPEKGGSWLSSRFDLPPGAGEVVVTLTPRIVRGPGFAASDLASICIGTETRVKLCDGNVKLGTATE